MTLIGFFLTSKQRGFAHWINTAKGLWVDWFLVIPFFPIFAFIDLINRTDLFLPLLGYWLGSGFYVVGLLKLAEFVWKYSFDEIYSTPVETVERITKKENESEFENHLTFVHQVTIKRDTMQRLSFGYLYISMWVFFGLF
eukprot:TRINITY_DN2371_c0_g1_i2.p2 TRINITY_DN2371_c0_g1~~TRINITY_DN2371_c0_g1_i2.p2  ORF type:complete len:140 (-),score=32.58 TRINITY_DN2371_c0_g1_i2:701-1120(-)